jgi:hypothetical protein
MTKDFIKTLETLVEREFVVSETLQLLKSDFFKYASWGVQSLTNFKDEGLLMNVNGHHYKSYVFIILAYNDTYTVHLVNNRGRVTETFNEVYFDQLTDVIDNRIERISAYAR